MTKPQQNDARLLLTKVQVPRRHPDTLPRRRLLEVLHQNLHRKLTFITAPAGYGKTTLLADFVTEAPARVCWYHITPEDQDLGRFVRYLAWALLQQYPELDSALQELVEGALPMQSPEALAGWFVNVMAEHVDDFTLLVLDDYHLVGEYLPVVDFIEFLLEHLPDHIRLLMASRSVYGIPAAKLFLRNELGVIGANDMRFTAEELRALARQAYHVELPEAYAEDLAQRTDGWIIAMLLAVRLRTSGTLPFIHGAQEHLYTFLAEEVLHQLPTPLVRFLLDSSIFTDFHPQLCEAVLGEGSAAYLEEIEARNLFVTRIETPTGPVFRYHQLFAEFLSDRLQRESPDRYRELHLKAAHWFWEHNVIEEAIAHRLAAGDRDGAIPWMDASAREMFIRGQNDILKTWMEALKEPPDRRDQAPMLLLYTAKALSNARQFTESDDLLRMAKPLLEKKPHSLSYANLLITQGFNAYFQNQPQQALTLAEETLQIFYQQEDIDDFAALRKAQAQRLKALASCKLGNADVAIEVLEQVVHDLQQLRERASAEWLREIMYNLATALQDMGFCYFQKRRANDALQCFTRAHDIWRKHHLNPAEKPSLLNNLAYLYTRLGQVEQALAIYDEALETARRHHSRGVSNILSGKATTLFFYGQEEQALTLFTQALEEAKRVQAPDLLSKVHWMLAKLWGARGDFLQAFLHLREAALAQHHPQNSVWYQWREGYLYWLLEKSEEALPRLQRIQNQQDALEDEEQIRFLLIFAALLAQQGEDEAAGKYLTQALQHLASLGYLYFLRFEARRLLPFLREWQKTLNDAILQALITLASSEQRPKTQKPTTITTPRQRLEVYGFGSGRVLRGGKAIPRAAWRAARARALFFFILERGQVRKEEIALAFWPDFSPAQINSNLHATLWRVRHALENKAIIQVSEGIYTLHPDVHFEYDVRMFEDMLARARQASGEARFSLYQNAARLYRGDFLEDLDMPWIDERRYELQRLYRQALEMVVNHLMTQKSYQEAMRWLARGLKIDPFYDQWHLQWMQCLAATGTPGAARNYYQTYRERLHRELHISPDERLTEFYHQLAQHP